MRKVAGPHSLTISRIHSTNYEVCVLKLSHFIRQFHRWMSIIFTLLVIAVFVISTRPAPPEWAFYMPLPALALMLFSGLYLFVLPYVRKGKA